MGGFEEQGHILGLVSANWFLFDIRPLFLEIQPQDYFRVLGVRLRLVKFDLEKYRAKFISEVKDWGHITNQVSSWCLSFSFHIQWTKYDQECLTFITYRILKNDSFFFFTFSSDCISGAIMLISKLCSPVPQPWPWIRYMQKSSSMFPKTCAFFVQQSKV